MNSFHHGDDIFQHESAHLTYVNKVKILIFLKISAGWPDFGFFFLIICLFFGGPTVIKKSNIENGRKEKEKTSKNPRNN